MIRTAETCNIEIDPLLQLLQLHHACTGPEIVYGPLSGGRPSAVRALLDHVIKFNMIPWYQNVGLTVMKLEPGSIPADELERMALRNKEALQKIDDRIAEAEATQGDADVRSLWIEKIDHYCSIGDRENASHWICETLVVFPKVSVGAQVELQLKLIRMNLGYKDAAGIRASLIKASEIIEGKDLDWERRNRLRVYEGIRAALNRNFTDAAELFCGAVATFSSYELFTYRSFLTLTVILTTLISSRTDLKEKVLHHPEVLAQKREPGAEKDLLIALRLAQCLHECNYEDFFAALEGVCMLMLQSPYLSVHVDHYYREMRIKAFEQFLRPYESVSIAQMASSFAVTGPVLDMQLASFIAARRLPCSVDAVSGTIVATRRDEKSDCYFDFIKQTDILLNKMQKLMRVVS